MKLHNGSLVALTAVAMACGAGQAHAEGGFIDEVRVGVLEHDTDIVGNQKEDGIDIGFEILTHRIDALEPVGNPQFVFGGLVNSEGYTNQVYAGLQSRWEFSQGVFNANDAFFLEGMAAIAWQDGKDDVTGTPEEAEWKSHGMAWGFRTGFGVGYRFNEDWTLALSFAHFSNADLADPNEGANDIGLRLGWRP